MKLQTLEVYTESNKDKTRKLWARYGIKTQGYTNMLHEECNKLQFIIRFQCGFQSRYNIHEQNKSKETHGRG